MAHQCLYSFALIWIFFVLRYFNKKIIHDMIYAKTKLIVKFYLHQKRSFKNDLKFPFLTYALFLGSIFANVYLHSFKIYDVFTFIIINTLKLYCIVYFSNTQNSNYIQIWIFLNYVSYEKLIEMLNKLFKDNSIMCICV